MIKYLTSLEPRMTTEAADRNEPLRATSPIETREWLHKECGHFQQVPLEGGDVQCDNCNTWVHLASKARILSQGYHINVFSTNDIRWRNRKAEQNQQLPKIDLPFKMVTLKRRNHHGINCLMVLLKCEQSPLLFNLFFSLNITVKEDTRA